MKKTSIPALAMTILLATACHKDKGPVETKSYTFDFNDGLQGWAVGFSDYGESHGDLQLKWEIAALPAPLDATKKALNIAGHNRSDDLFMFLKRKVTGFDPNRNYRVKLDLIVASDAASNAVGIGGAPGEAVVLKAGATAVEPVSTKNAGGYYELNVDKGNQSIGGADMKVIGDVANGTDQFKYVSLNRSSGSQVLTVKTDSNGECWLIIGTDSGYEGLTSLYYQQVNASFERVQ